MIQFLFFIFLKHPSYFRLSLGGFIYSTKSTVLNCTCIIMKKLIKKI